MATNYTTVLKLALPVTGELSGTWGDVVNNNITQMVEQAITGLAPITTWSGASHTLTTADGTTSESRCAILECSGAPGAAATVICPTNPKIYILKNTVSGGYAVTLKTAAGTGVSVVNGGETILYCDGTNVVAGVDKIGLAIITAATGSFIAPVGTTAERDASPLAGYLRFNSSLTRFEGYNGTVWSQVGGGATGGGNDQIFVQNGQTVTANYTIPTSFNAMSTGPITIDAGIVVTIPSGSVWAVI
jgi:hypothetical protein